MNVLGEVAEEVVVKHGADAGKQFRVDCAAAENVVDVGPFAIQLTCKPFDIVSFGLLVKNFTYMSTYMVHERREIDVRFISSRASPNAFNRNKQSTPTPNRYIGPPVPGSGHNTASHERSLTA